MQDRAVPARKDGRIVIHFDYDCFYASVFEVKNPILKSLPFAVQQKQIIVTCNYKARQRGLHKLQLIKEARAICPDVIIELGEDISRFRDASKELYNFLKAYSWNGKVERLGFDEVWMDVTDMVDYNMDTINPHDLTNSFFHMSRHDPLDGFSFDATAVAGHTFPANYQHRSLAVEELTLRLRLGSHLALYMRHQLEQQKGYTSTVGIATSKLLSKLVGNLNKPKGQTTVMPPLDTAAGQVSNVTMFMDAYEIGKVPNIGFKLAQRLREFILRRPAKFDAGLVYGGTKENVTVHDVRTCSEISPESLEKILAGPGSPHGIGNKIWCLLHGVDDAEVSQAKAVPSQISIEDSYIRLDTMPEVMRELGSLARSLITRMRIDLLGDEDDLNSDDETKATDEAQTFVTDVAKRWLAHPKTLRLTTRPRQPLQPDGTRVRSFKRISHSAPLPTFVFNLQDSIDALAEKLVQDHLVSMFRRLHPERSGWNLSLVNLAVTNMAETAGDSRTANGRNIGHMFKRQDYVLRDFKVVDEVSDLANRVPVDRPLHAPDAQDAALPELDTQHAEHAVYDTEDNMCAWDEDGAADEEDSRCDVCGLRLPAFAMDAHRRFHSPTAT